MLNAFFWVIPWRQNFIYRRFGTRYLFHLHRQVSAYENGTDSVPKRRHIKFRRLGITKKKAYNKYDEGGNWLLLNKGIYLGTRMTSYLR